MLDRMSRRAADSERASAGQSRIDGVHDRYIEFAKRTLPRDLAGRACASSIDCANGAAYKVAPAALWELGAEVIPINVEPDGFNINGMRLDPPEALQKKVREVRADIGIALDGDADRVVIVDERGHIVDGDQLLAVIAQILAGRAAVSPARRRRDRDVEPRPRALSRRAHGLELIAPRSATATSSSTCARHGLQHRRRAVRPHHPVRLLRPRATAGGGAAGARRASSAPTSR
jgi:hypothetical protein